jgi:uncharacterized protein DUF4255
VSNFLGIATVTAVLRNYLLHALPAEVSGAGATAVRPDAPASQLPSLGVNLFLYQISQNPAITQEDWPMRSGSGKVLRRPRIGINLHYLLSFYGDEARLEPQQVLGAVTHRLNAQPVLDRDFIRTTVADTFYAYIAASDLADAVEMVKLTPQNLSLEEMTKLWSVFQETSYALSTAYVASVVMLETRLDAPRALPVHQRNIGVAPFAKVSLQSAAADGPLPDATVAGSVIRLAGAGFDGTLSRIEVGNLPMASLTLESSQSLTFTLSHPDLRAGFQAVRARSGAGYLSNALSFQVRPAITLGPLAAGQLTVNFTPNVGRRQRVELILNQKGALPGIEPVSRVIPAPSENGITNPLADSAAAIAFPVAGLPAGNYLVRASVDGAENLLERAWNGTEWEFTQPLAALP